MNTEAASPSAHRGGLGALILAALSFSAMSVLVKLAGANLPTQQIVLVRGVVGLVFIYWLARRGGIRLGGTRKGLLWLRGLFGFAALSCFFYALIHLPLAEATVIQYTNPIWTMVLAAIFLGERLTMRVCILAVLGLSGVAVISRPAFLFGGEGPGFDPFVVGVALTGALMSASAYVTVRKLAGTESTLVIVFYFTLVSAIGSLPWNLQGFVRPSLTEWGLLLGVATTALAGQLYLTRGLRREEAGRATSVGYLQVVFASAWGFLFFAEAPDWWTVGGSLLILGSVLAIAREKRRLQVTVPG